MKSVESKFNTTSIIVALIGAMAVIFVGLLNFYKPSENTITTNNSKDHIVPVFNDLNRNRTMISKQQSQSQLEIVPKKKTPVANHPMDATNSEVYQENNTTNGVNVGKNTGTINVKQ